MAENTENNSLLVNEGRTSERGAISRGFRRQFETFVQMRKLSVRKILLIFAGGFCALLLGLIIFILSRNFNSDRPNRVNVSDQKLYKDPGVYEIITESIKDSSPRAEDGLRREGQGVGDIRGIIDVLNYIKDDVGSRVIFINSFFDSNDDDHMAIADHMKIKNVFGTMDDFDLLRNITKEEKVRLIIDFIPNHTGRGSPWFEKSQKKEGNYKDYYIWAPCDPKKNTYPNDWMSVKGRRAWTYDETRGECFFHQLEDDKPDLNLRNPDVQKKLENILRFWLDKGVDGFHIRNVQYLYEDHKLGNESPIPGRTGQAYSDFEHNQTRNHPENAKILQAWKAVLDTYSTELGEEKVLIITADDDLNATLRYMKAGVALLRVNPLSGNGASLAERIETTRMFTQSSREWDGCDKYSSRLASREGSQQTKALLTLQATLPGVPFIYYGNEIGMTDHPEVPEPLKYRTPMQWNSNGTGFSMNRPWIDRNPNYKTINVERERASDDINSPLKLNQKLQKLREMEPFRSGVMNVPFRDGNLLVYTREAGGFPGYLVAINFGGTSMPLSNTPGIPQKGKIVFHSHKEVNTTINVSLNSYELGPHHAVVFEFI